MLAQSVVDCGRPEFFHYDWHFTEWDKEENNKRCPAYGSCKLRFERKEARKFYRKYFRPSAFHLFSLRRFIPCRFAQLNVSKCIIEMKNEYLREFFASVLGNWYAQAHKILLCVCVVECPDCRIGSTECRSSHEHLRLSTHFGYGEKKSISVLQLKWPFIQIQISWNHSISLATIEHPVDAYIKIHH